MNTEERTPENSELNEEETVPQLELLVVAGIGLIVVALLVSASLTGLSFPITTLLN